jgi:hypothetical protein
VSCITALEIAVGPLVIRYSLFVVRHSHAPWSLVRPASLDLPQRRLDPRRVERKIADAFAGGVGEGIGNGGDRGPCEPSPEPSGRSFGRLISSISTFGASGMVRIG